VDLKRRYRNIRINERMKNALFGTVTNDSCHVLWWPFIIWHDNSITVIYSDSEDFCLCRSHSHVPPCIFIVVVIVLVTIFQFPVIFSFLFILILLLYLILKEEQERQIAMLEEMMNRSPSLLSEISHIAPPDPENLTPKFGRGLEPRHSFSTNQEGRTVRGN